MKKLYVKRAYKIIHRHYCYKHDKRRAISRIKRKNRIKLLQQYSKNSKSTKSERTVDQNNTHDRNVLQAPADFRLLDNTEDCLRFFRDMRSEQSIHRVTKSPQKHIYISLKHIEYIDYATISTLIAILNDLKVQRINTKCKLPLNKGCRDIIAASGFLNRMYFKGHSFPLAEKSEIFFFEQGAGRLSAEENKNISDLVKNVVRYLTAEVKDCPNIKSMILEICGNSIQWAGEHTNRWLLGVMYEDGFVRFAAVDLGRGILDTLKKKFRRQLFDVVTFISEKRVLEGAFDKKYGSATGDENRNKGLPSVKTAFEKGGVKNLKVLTNNVILYFDDNSKSRVLNDARYKGTLYQWTMDASCINNIMN